MHESCPRSAGKRPEASGKVKKPVGLPERRVAEDEVPWQVHGAVGVGEVYRDCVMLGEPATGDLVLSHQQSRGVGLRAGGVGPDCSTSLLEQLRVRIPERLTDDRDLGP